jgi:integrative and conjugative element protein (TIGR02256 family)
MPTTKLLWIAESALKHMRELAGQFQPLETGGMILGYDATSKGAVVTAVVGPGPQAKHRRFRFRPDYDYQQAQLEKHFAHTQGKETYLGDWHTHPSGACALSWLDKRVLARIAKTPSSGTSNPIMVILADGRPAWDIHASQFLASPGVLFGRISLLQITPIEFGLHGEVRD